ncbi:hypothetical protein [Desulfoluna sp.]|uniref:hypothetical protein n=1 Tax=Desulfoluna sp. TaxID=2045199 RepID=UPI002632F7C3|nr:hypothetical protein [Desulfoluna sp.]
MSGTPWLLVGASAVLCFPLALELRAILRVGTLCAGIFYLFLFVGSCMLIDIYLMDIPLVSFRKPVAMAEEVKSRLMQDPVCRALKVCDPQGYQEVADCMVSSEYGFMQEAYASCEINRILSRSFHTHLPRASDDALSHYLQAVIREMQEKAWDQSDFCLSARIRGDAGADRAYFETDDIRSLYIDVFIEVLESAAEGGHPCASRAAYDQSMTAVLEELHGNYGDELRLLGDPERYVKDDADKSTYCRLIMAYYETISFQSSDDVGAIVRWLCSNR